MFAIAKSIVGGLSVDVGRVRMNHDEQARLYGAPLGEVFADITTTYRLSQGGLAKVLGLSAPMLSQLASAQRIKIGNPAAVERLQRLLTLAPQVRSGQMSTVDALAAVEAEAPGQVLTRTSQLLRRQGAAAVTAVLRSAADAHELEQAAALLQSSHPALAQVIRMYGAGHGDAVEHYSSVISGPVDARPS